MPDPEQPRSELSQRGALVLGVAVVMFLFGMARADGILASICLLVLLSFPYMKWRGQHNLQGLTLRCQAAHRALVGQSFVFNITLQRRTNMSFSHNLTLHMQARGCSHIQSFFGMIDPNTPMERELSMEMKQRGEIASFVYQILSSYPLGLWHHSLEGKIDHPLIVAPRPVISKKLFLNGWWCEGIAAWAAGHTSHVGEIRGLRAWRPGDSFKQVHPAASARSYARGQGLMVAETDPPGYAPRHVTVMFHSYATDRAIIRPEIFERALSYLSGTLRYLWQQSLPTTLMADFDDWLEQSCCNRRELQDVSDHFSRVKRRMDTEFHELLRVQSQLDPQTSLIMISDMPVCHWKSAIIRREIPTIILPLHISKARRDSRATKP